MEEVELCEGSPGSPFTVMAAAAVQEQHDYKRPQKAGGGGGAANTSSWCVMNTCERIRVVSQNRTVF